MNATLRAVARNREYRGLFTGELLSTFGDQMARIALAVLAWSITGSATITGITYAATFLPTLLSGLFLGRVADRWPRRRVLIGTDLIRAALAAAMAIPGLPIAVLMLLTAVITLLGPLFKAAQTAATLEALPNQDEFKLAQSLRFGVLQLGQVGGFALGGVISLIDPHLGLLINAATFLASAACLTTLRPRPAPAPHSDQTPTLWAVLGSSSTVRALVAVSMILLPLIVPEAIAVPLAYQLNAPAAAGWILASAPIGSVLGVLALGWHRIAARTRPPDAGEARGEETSKRPCQKPF